MKQFSQHYVETAKGGDQNQEENNIKQTGNITPITK